MAMMDGVRDDFRVGAGEAELTLRLVARLPAPEGLEDRIQSGMKLAVTNGRITGRMLAWPGAQPMTSGWMRAAAAAAIVFVVAGGGYGVYSRVQPGLAIQEVTTPRAGRFGEAGAAVRPKTLQGPSVTRPMGTQDGPMAVPVVSSMPKERDAINVKTANAHPASSQKSSRKLGMVPAGPSVK
jgi:hypothetical protein